MDVGRTYEGRYTLRRELGGGGFGKTFVAWDDARGEEVVFKVLRLERADDWKAVELFEREAGVLENLSHEAIPEYVDRFELEPGVWCLVQRLAPGITLEQKVRGGWAPDRDALLDLTRRLLRVLVYLHERTPPVIHRDIKPENVLVAEDGRVSLVDFGSVRVSSSESMSSTVSGTFGYMAPEQLRGQALPQTDLFGLGSTLLFVMTGKQPEELPTSRLKVDSRAAAPQASERVHAWLDHMIDPIIEERFGSARDALDALKHEAGKVAASTTPPGEPLAPRGRHHPALDALRSNKRRALIVSCALIVFGVILHATGKLDALSMLIDDKLAILVGLLSMSTGAMGSLVSSWLLGGLDAQNRLELQTGRELPVSKMAKVPIVAQGEGQSGVLTLSTRSSPVLRWLAAAALFMATWLMALNTMSLGLSSALDPSVLVGVGFFAILAGTSWYTRSRRPGVKLSNAGVVDLARHVEYDASEILGYDVRVVEQEGARTTYSVELWLTLDGGREDACVYRIEETSRELAHAQRQLLAELAEERLVPHTTYEPEAREEDVVLDFARESVEQEAAAQMP